ncbi:MAG: hypothetical protein EOM54_02085 [Clostridia bacterium]|nr:hypothetical protein [Clostridia bacterium]
MQRYFKQGEDLEQDPTMKNIFRLSLKKPENIFALWRENGKLCTMTYGEAQRRVFPAAAALQERGFPPGACIGLKLKNCPEWGILFWAVLMAGYRPVMLDAAAGETYDAQVIGHTLAAALIAEDKTEAGIPVIAPEDLLNGDGVPVKRWANEIMFCSSGTSGERTVQVFGGESVTAQILAARVMPEYSGDIMYPDEDGPLRNLAILPFHHIFGFVAVFLWYTFFQKTIVYPESLAPSVVTSLAREAGVTHIFSVPLLWNGIAARCAGQAEAGGSFSARVLRLILRAAEEENPEKYLYRQKRIPDFVKKQVRQNIFGNKIRFLISGGSYVSPHTLRVINAMGYPLYNGYGLTEAGITSVELVPTAAARTAGNIGVPLTRVEYRITDGSLQLRSPQTAKGRMQLGRFIPAPAPDGWLDTGDVAREENGRLYVVGRKKEIIITAAGENIPPELLESELGTLEGIKNLCVLGLCMDDGEETVSLVLEPEGELSDISWRQIHKRITEANGKLPDYMRFKRVYLARQPIYTTNTLKTQRLRMKSDIEAGLFKLSELKLAGESGGLQYEVPVRLLEAVAAAFAEALSIDRGTVAYGADFMLDLHGDSLSYAELVTVLEERFGVIIPPEAYGSCFTVEAFGELFVRLGVRL